MRGTVENRNGRWSLDRDANFTSLVSQEIILSEFISFLEDCRRVGLNGSLLDLGAGTKPYAPLYETYFAECTSVDVPHSPHDTAQVDLMASADSLPFADGAFDCIVCTEVLEHCAEPQLVMREISRVLQDGGRAFVTTPFLLPLHEMPYDFFRYTPSALRYLATKAGLEVRSISPRGSYISVLFASGQMPLTKAMQKLEKVSGLPFGRPGNPAVLIFVVIPQLLYLRLHRWARRHSAAGLARLEQKLSYATHGYVTVIEKAQR